MKNPTHVSAFNRTVKGGHSVQWLDSVVMEGRAMVGSGGGGPQHCRPNAVLLSGLPMRNLPMRNDNCH